MEDRIKKEGKIYAKLCKEFGLGKLGCAVHCTCDMQERYEKWLVKIGYSNGHKDSCLLVRPNFWYKPEDFTIMWYKYPLRDSYSNKEISLKEFKAIIDKCIESVKGEVR